VDALVDSKEYSDYFGEETVPLCADWVKKDAATGCTARFVELQRPSVKFHNSFVC